MPLVGLSRVIVQGAVLAGLISGAPRAGVAPNACAFVTVAEVSTLVGQQEKGGQVSTVDHAGSNTSSCLYVGGATVVVTLGGYPSPAGAQQEYASQLQKTAGAIVETGVGDRAFSTSGDVTSIVAVRGNLLATIGIIGKTSVTHDRLRGLMVTALSR